MQENDTITLTFSPALPCFRCERLTTIAQFDKHYLGFQPQCAEHGLLWQCSTSAQFESVVRFVMFKFEQVGKAIVLNQCSVTIVPGYQIEQDDEQAFTDLVWLVRYEHENEQLTLYVIWHVDDLRFELVPSI